MQTAQRIAGLVKYIQQQRPNSALVVQAVPANCMVTMRQGNLSAPPLDIIPPLTPLFPASPGVKEANAYLREVLPNDGDMFRFVDCLEFTTEDEGAIIRTQYFSTVHSLGPGQPCEGCTDCVHHTQQGDSLIPGY